MRLFLGQGQNAYASFVRFRGLFSGTSIALEPPETFPPLGLESRGELFSSSWVPLDRAR